MAQRRHSEHTFFLRFCHPPFFSILHKMVWFTTVLVFMRSMYRSPHCAIVYFSFVFFFSSHPTTTRDIIWKWLVVFSSPFGLLWIANGQEPSPFCWTRTSLCALAFFWSQLCIMLFYVPVFSISLIHATNGSVFRKTRDLENAKGRVRYKKRVHLRKKTLLWQDVEKSSADEKL